NTKTADAVKSLPRKHAMVLTGTPLENKLEDVYSIIQFLDPDRLSPLWAFAADHFMLSRKKKGKILGYRNLDKLYADLQSIVIRRKKHDVLDQLPHELVNNYFIDLTADQRQIHAGYAQYLLPLMNKKYLTPMDLRRIQELLLKMRQVCNSTYLIDRNTQISPKLKELESILSDLAGQDGRKIVIFSEWTTMTYLIARHLSNAGIDFVEMSGKVPVKRRQDLIDEFTNNPDCRVFLSTDAGGTGLNLQAADCVINFELPWNPAKMNQRIGRVSRIGQESGTVNVINLIAKDSIEERIYAGIQLKTDLFQGVFDGTTDMVEFSREKRTEMLNQLREMMQEEPEPVVSEQADAEEIPEDTPHYLNPEVFRDKESPFAYDAEETGAGGEADISGDMTMASETSDARDSNRRGKAGGDGAADATDDGGAAATDDGGAAAVFAQQPPEKMEAVLNQGMSFIGGLLEMATGQKIDTAASEDKMVKIDKETGEVTMKFKLPGFG
ncbi:MAG: DEAD/DEAH box helicase, partial [Thermodesulfobacteriota bacterium]